MVSHANSRIGMSSDEYMRKWTEDQWARGTSPLDAFVILIEHVSKEESLDHTIKKDYAKAKSIAAGMVANYIRKIPYETE